MENLSTAQLNAPLKKSKQRTTERTPRPGVRTKIVTDISGFDELYESWDDLAEQSGTHFFLSFEWQRTWWRHFAEGTKRQQLHIILFYEDDQLIGIAPFFIDYFRFVGKNIYRCLRLIGTKVMQDKKGTFQGERTYSDFLDLLIKPGFEEQVCSELYKHLRSFSGFDDIELEEIPEESALNKYFVPLVENDSKNDWSVQQEKTSRCMIVEFPESWDDFLQGISKRARYDARQYLKSVEDNSEKKIFDSQELKQEAEIWKGFDWLVDTHQERWNNRGRPGAFADMRMYNLFREVTLLYLKKGRVRFQVVTPKGEQEYLAVDLMYYYNNKVYGIQRTFDENSAYVEACPGHVSLFVIMKDILNKGYDSINFLRGEERYKRRVSNKKQQNHKILIQKTNRENKRIKRYEWIRKRLLTKHRISLEWGIIKAHFKNNGVFTALANYRKDLKYRSSKKYKSKKKN